LIGITDRIAAKVEEQMDEIRDSVEEAKEVVNILDEEMPS
jgi:hypothetical protein